MKIASVGRRHLRYSIPDNPDQSGRVLLSAAAVHCSIPVDG
jgi:hypothetical protein